jgi:gp6-like head-tail connector protein
MTKEIEDRHNSQILSLWTMKQYLRIVSDEEDNLIENFIKTAIAIAEGYIGHSLLQRTRKVSFYNIKKEVILPHGGDVTILKVIDKDGNIFNDWFLGEKGIRFTSLEAINSATIVYSEGFKQVSDIPAPIISALMAHVATLYDDRYGGGLAPVKAVMIYQKYRVSVL